PARLRPLLGWRNDRRLPVGAVDDYEEVDRKLARLDRHKHQLHRALLLQESLSDRRRSDHLYRPVGHGIPVMEKGTPRAGIGLVIGKFMPPHRGHQYLIEAARSRVERLTVLLFTKPGEPIPGDLRYAWMTRLFPDVPILLITDDGPVDFDDPDIWA